MVNGEWVVEELGCGSGCQDGEAVWSVVAKYKGSIRCLALFEK